MSNTITVKALAQEARNLAELEPNRVADCSYTHYEGGASVPNCIVGQAAFNLGVSIEDLSKVNECSLRFIADSMTLEWLDAPADDAKVYVSWLSNLQAAQDGGDTWGEALRKADRRFVMNQFNI